MNTAQPTQTDQTQDQPFVPQDQKQQASPQQTVPVSGSTGAKEVEPLVSPHEGVQEISSEIEVSPEVEQAGVKGFRETIELPPDVKKLGVTPASQPLASLPPSLPQVTLPLSDSAVVTGLHASLLAAIRWLATWCIKKLKKAHIALKTVHGKVIRVKA